MLCAPGSTYGSIFSVFREQLVWLDETGSNSKDHIHRFGYAIRGTTPISHCLLVRGKRVNAIAALASNGIIAVDTMVGTVDGRPLISSREHLFHVCDLSTEVILIQSS